MIHQYKLGGYNIVLDVCSGALHVVDDLSYVTFPTTLSRDSKRSTRTRRNSTRKTTGNPAA